MQADQATSGSCTSGPGNGPLTEIGQINADMTVGLTEAAARHITRYLGRRGKGVGVRLGVKTTGCSGLAYKIEFADEIASAALPTSVPPVTLVTELEWAGSYTPGALHRPVDQSALVVATTSP